MTSSEYDPWAVFESPVPTQVPGALDVGLALRRLRQSAETSSRNAFLGTPCVLWTGHIDREGYPNKVQIAGRVTSAHRLSYWVAFGPIPDGLQIDHRCHDPATCSPSPVCEHRRCINPLHLEAVTPRENTLRSGGVAAFNARMRLCSRGHAWDKIHSSGRRRCSRCEQELAREEYARRRPAERAARAARRRELNADDERRIRRNRSASLAKKGLKPDECLNGHSYQSGSYRVGPSGRRICLRCRAERDGRRA